MVRHHLKEREPNWQRGVAINGVGAVATAIVTLIVATTKFTSGAWVPLVVIPMIVVLFKAIKRHYAGGCGDGLRVPADYRPRRMNHTVVVLVGSIHRGVLEALAYAKSLAPNHLVAVTRRRPTRTSRSGSRRRGPNANLDIPLEIVHSPYRELDAARSCASSTSSTPATRTTSSPW